MQNIADFLNQAEKDPVLLLVHVDRTNQYLSDIFSGFSVQTISDDTVSALIENISYSVKLSNLLFKVADSLHDLYNQGNRIYRGHTLLQLIEKFKTLDKNKWIDIGSYDVDHQLLWLIETYSLSKEQLLLLLDVCIDRAESFLDDSVSDVNSGFEKYISLTEDQRTQDLDKQLELLYKFMAKRKAISA